MTRVTSPTQPFSSAEAVMPTPKFQVGDLVTLDFRLEVDRPYYWKQILRNEIRQVRRFMPQKPMHPHNKAQIREKMEGARNAATIQISGIYPWGGQNVGNVATEGYLAGWPGAATPLVYHYFLCFRWTNAEGHPVAYIPTIGNAHNNMLSPVNLPPIECPQ
ncbi:hypothetical protein PVE_R2G0444 [Pseudomonas veronii 1YdBTEX2]|uniref:Uncharacterized protein n=2 Tax=Pseudomonas fluorescens group TaxID=136843 RepID=A0A1D3K840_PSEVE|nr:hypothetical protein PVE_R2G0444 [Pseudomonas veronii 1YdBTEX2]